MNPRINFEAKTDRELLLLTAQKTNDLCDKIDILNGTVQENKGRIRKLEARPCFTIPNPSTIKSKVTDSLGRSQFIILIASIAGGVIYAFGKAIGWW